jgi:hypothetical protein
MPNQSNTTTDLDQISLASPTVVDPMFNPQNGGRLYVTNDANGELCGALTNFDGDRVGIWFRTGTYRTNFGASIDCIQALIQGDEFYGRKSANWSQYVNLRPFKSNNQEGI